MADERNKHVPTQTDSIKCDNCNVILPPIPVTTPGTQTEASAQELMDISGEEKEIIEIASNNASEISLLTDEESNPEAIYELFTISDDESDDILVDSDSSVFDYSSLLITGEVFVNNSDSNIASFSGVLKSAQQIGNYGQSDKQSSATVMTKETTVSDSKEEVLDSDRDASSIDTDSDDTDSSETSDDNDDSIDSIDSDDNDDSEDSDDSEDIDDSEDRDDSEDIDDSEDRDDSEDIDDSEDRDDSEDIDDSEDRDDSEDIDDNEDRDDSDYSVGSDNSYDSDNSDDIDGSNESDNSDKSDVSQVTVINKIENKTIALSINAENSSVENQKMVASNEEKQQISDKSVNPQQYDNSSGEEIVDETNKMIAKWRKTGAIPKKCYDKIKITVSESTRKIQSVCSDNKSETMKDISSNSADDEQDIDDESLLNFFESLETIENRSEILVYHKTVSDVCNAVQKLDETGKLQHQYPVCVIKSYIQSEWVLVRVFGKLKQDRDEVIKQIKRLAFYHHYPTNIVYQNYMDISAEAMGGIYKCDRCYNTQEFKNRVPVDQWHNREKCEYCTFCFEKGHEMDGCKIAYNNKYISRTKGPKKVRNEEEQSEHELRIASLQSLGICTEAYWRMPNHEAKEFVATLNVHFPNEGKRFRYSIACYGEKDLSEVIVHQMGLKGGAQFKYHAFSTNVHNIFYADDAEYAETSLLELERGKPMEVIIDDVKRIINNGYVVVHDKRKIFKWLQLDTIRDNFRFIEIGLLPQIKIQIKNYDRIIPLKVLTLFFLGREIQEPYKRILRGRGEVREVLNVEKQSRYAYKCYLAWKELNEKNQIDVDFLYAWYDMEIYEREELAKRGLFFVRVKDDKNPLKIIRYVIEPTIKEIASRVLSGKYANKRLTNVDNLREILEPANNR